MKKVVVFGFTAIFMSACNFNNEETKIFAGSPTVKAETSENVNPNQHEPNMTLHDFSIKTLDGKDFDFATLKGKRVLIVNTASECGYTPQYEQLQQLYEEFGGDGFTIVGFPSNDFGGQEPGSNEEIKEFCEKNYGVTFPMMTKISIKGKDVHPIYQWLTDKEKNGVDEVDVRWNFNKFLIDEKGQWVAYYPSKVSPLDEEIIAFAKGQ